MMSPRKKTIVIDKEPLPQETVSPDEQDVDEPLYKVILFNDNVNYIGNVISALQEAIHCSFEVAEHIANLAHNQGKALVTSGALEYAKQVYSVLISWKLMCVIERA